MAEYQPDTLDLQILRALHRDGRAGYDEIGDRLDVTGDAVRRRVRDMTDAGIIQGFTVMTNPVELGYIPVAFGLGVEAGRTDEIAARLAECENVYKIWVLSGRHNVVFHACFADIPDFQAFNHEVLHEIGGISSVESSLATNIVKDEGSIVLVPDAVDEVET